MPGVVYPYFTLELMLDRYRRVLLEMRRSRDEFEAARQEFYMARVEFTNTLDVWSSRERLRDGDYDKKLTHHCERLQQLGTEHVDKALEETRKSMSEMVWPLAPSDKNSWNLQFSFDGSGAESKGVLVGSRLQAEEFFIKSQQMLSKRLLELRGQFVSTIRKLAEHANRTRVENLKEAIGAFRNDMESELRGEILVDLESLAVDVRTLAFQTIQRSLKTERVRCVGISSSSPYRLCNIHTDILHRKCTEYSKTLLQNLFWPSKIILLMTSVQK